MTNRTSWAVLLCKFKDDTSSFPTINKQDLVDQFTSPEIENVVTYWHDASYGELDLTGSKVFGWVTLDQSQKDYKGLAGRRELVNWARQKAGETFDIAWKRFFGVIVFMSTRTDLWGASGTVVCDVASNLSQILQEVGHGYGLVHSRSVANPIDYQDPYCIMSGLTFGGANPTFAGRFGQSGPRLCSPYAFRAGWLPQLDQVRVDSNGRRPVKTELTLNRYAFNISVQPQVAVIDFDVPEVLTYFIEYRRASDWDRGLSQDALVIHQLRPDGYAYYAGRIPTSVGFENGVTLLPGKAYIDPVYDLSIQVVNVHDGSIDILIALAAAAQPLSVRDIARRKLGRVNRISIRNDVALQANSSLRGRLIEILEQ